MRYRQRITLTKKDEDNNALPKVKFLLTAKNIKELYSFRFNGWGEPEGDEVDEDQSRFEIEALTDSNGKITYKFDYQIQSEIMQKRKLKINWMMKDINMPVICQKMEQRN